MTTANATKVKPDNTPVSGRPGDHPAALDWVNRQIHRCKPARVHWCDGSQAEYDKLIAQGVEEGIFIRLNEQRWPGCVLHRSNPTDVARSEDRTFICGPSDDIAGATNNWMDNRKARQMLNKLFDGCMSGGGGAGGGAGGRTMYVIPFIMGPLGSPLAKVGIQVTDSLYVAVSMRIMTRMGQVAWEQLGTDGDFTKCLHSVGEFDPETRYICHFPLENSIISFGSGYGGNALLGKKCMALRIASFLGRQQGWMAEHMLLMGVQEPGGRKTYVAGAFPSACGKTNFAMLIPPRQYADEGWKVTTVGDDIAWMWVDPQSGKMRAINPEKGYFGVVPGTNDISNPNALKMIQKDTIFTNVAYIPETGDVWWEGKTRQPPEKCIDWKGNDWTSGSSMPAAHPNSRFTTPMSNNPVLDPSADDPAGVEISAIVFGGRRSKVVPLCYQAFNWIHGVYIGATLGSETTAAATSAVGVVRRDPMAMLPFIGYNIRDYLQHWFAMRKKMLDCPRIFAVNWFRKDESGKFLWPGYGENMRVLEWIINRCRGRAYATETPIGWQPRPEDINLQGLDISEEGFKTLERVENSQLKAEILSQEELFLKLAGDLPKEMVFQRELLISRL